ncbi:MAG: peptidoglycan DD-metalloendopeptidase family protein [Pseudohongiella sp.]|nr:peptidoglycan DD-metalloendopeptidase family protein [Pseudohongiella sp.]
MDVVGQGFLSVNGFLKTARLALCPFILVLSACGGGYQAPLDDRSSSLERVAPLIMVDGQPLPSSSRSAPATSNPTPASTGNTASTAPVGSAATVVRPVAVGSGISRAVTRNEAPAQASVEPTPANQSQTPVASSGTAPAGNSSGAASRPPVAPSSGAVHVVAQGDTLYSIAFTHNIDVRSLALVNDLAAPYTIFPGQRLNLSAAGVSAAAINAVPQIPAAPAGEATPAMGQRPQAAIDARRTGSVSTRQVEGVNWQWPADGRLLSTFSESGAARGIDIAGTQGQAVFAAADGDVVYAGRGIPGAGNLLILRHSERHLSAYMHNSSMLVAEGDRVQAGDKVAEIGTGPNGRDLLHFEVRVDGKPVDPVRYLPNR